MLQRLQVIEFQQPDYELCQTLMSIDTFSISIVRAKNTLIISTRLEAPIKNNSKYSGYDGEHTEKRNK